VLLTRATLAGCIGLIVAALPVTIGAGPGVVPPPASAPAGSDGAPLYRLGSAGRPFAFSTAVGDFNADGRPDVIVADRISPWSRNTGYRLDFAISGEAPASVSVLAPDDSIGIRVADVDHDSDLDIVLASTISGRTIAVWLNDGAGHFSRSSTPVPGLVVLTPEAIDQGQPLAAGLIFDLPPRRDAAMAPVQARAPSAATASTRLADTTPASASLLTVCNAAPRAPPTLL